MKLKSFSEYNDAEITKQVTEKRIKAPRGGFSVKDIENILKKSKDIELSINDKLFFIAPFMHDKGKLEDVDLKDDSIFVLDQEGERHEIKLKDIEFIEERLITENGLDILEQWKHEAPKQYVKKLMDVYGHPQYIEIDQAKWITPEEPWLEVFIKDEEIRHTFPADHTDFLYSTIKIPEWAPINGESTIPPEMAKTISETTGSITIDGLKGEITVRCGMMIKNAVSAGFVQDLVAGKIEPENAKEEYAQRIKDNIIPDWYEDKIDEK